MKTITTRFLLIFFATAVSGLGDGIIPIAFAIQTHRIDPSGQGLTAVLIALWVGRFIWSTLVTRLPRPTRPALWMIASDIARMAAQLLLVMWIALGKTHMIPAFVVSAFAYGCATAFFNPARFSLLSLVFPDTHRSRFNGYLSMLGDVLFVLGPLIGTAAMLNVSFTAVLVADGLSFLIAILLTLPFIRTRAHAEDTSADTAENAPKEHSPSRTKLLPKWVTIGLGTWLISATVTGFLGAAGPTWIMQRFDEKTWGFMAAALAVGSLCGSAATITNRLDRLPWNYLQFCALVCVAAQITALLFSPVFALIALVGAVASALVTASGIAWDVLGQSFKNAETVHRFATRDQLVFTTGIPLGMVIFAATATATATHTYAAGGALAVLLLMAGGCALRAKTHKEAKNTP